MFFVMALSYADPVKGWILRDFILSNDVDVHAVSAGKLINSIGPDSRRHVAQAA